MRPPSFFHERTLVQQGYTVIGVDEAGCGCLAGPVVAAACVLPLDSRIGLIRDSKLLSAAQRERVLAQLAARGARWAIGTASAEEIDAINIRQASLLAMRRAVEILIQPTMRGSEHSHASNGIRMLRIAERIPSSYKPFAALGSHSKHSNVPFVLVDAWTIPNLALPQRGIIHGDRLVKSIAAASIVAKCSRDAMMDTLHEQFPLYGFAQHRGYATVQHRQAIMRHGVTEHHRVSFCGQLLSVVERKQLASVERKSHS